MSKQREALKIALEVLDSKHNFQSAEWRHMHYQAFQIIREALAEPEQKSACFKCGHAWHPDECVNTSPPARKPLTDEQVDTIIASNVTITDKYLLEAVHMAIREVEAAHGIGGE